MTEQTANNSTDAKVDADIHTRNILKELCRNNAEYFAKDTTENGQRLYISFLSIIDSLDAAWPKRKVIEERYHEFDFDSSTPGNGYRSFMMILDSAIKLAIETSEKVLQKRDSVLFYKSILTKDVEGCAHLLSSLDCCLSHLFTLMSWSKKGQLFMDESHTPEDLFKQCGEINQHCFYGRHLGFYFCDSIRNILQFIALSMTLFSEVYYSEGSLISKATNSVVSTTKYISDPEQRARRIVNISQNAEVDFCKSFWFLAESELMNQLPSIVSPSVAVSKVISLLPEPLNITTSDGQTIEVPLPSSYIGSKPIKVRLISCKLREGMPGTKSMSGLDPPSKNLVIHCHGGGFVAQSSKSHEGYLRDWAKHLDAPILCIDYSLAPEAPFPRALEEILYAYCWAKENHSLLGSTGENVVGAGDSAGANLLLTATLKCINMKIPLMKGLFVAYVPTGVHFIPSPARMLCMMDPLLPFGFLMRCLKAYACPSSDLLNHIKSDEKPTTANGSGSSDMESFEEISESDVMELQARKSPASEAASDTLTYGSLTSNEAPEENSTLGGNTEADMEKSKYVSDFLAKYVLNPETDETKKYSAEMQTRPESTSSSQTTFDYSFPRKLTSLVASLKGRFTKYLSDRNPSGAEKLLDIDVNYTQSSMMDRFTFTVPKNPYLSPIFATDDELQRFPPVRILTVHMDPCLDDCVSFASRLKNLGCNVKLDILDGLPHGFLNFSLFSKEAFEGSKVCVGRIEELLNLQQ
nr:unnamed protein product [Callosobruchus chinensis]